MIYREYKFVEYYYIEYTELATLAAGGRCII